jgi:hypothetical protein
MLFRTLNKTHNNTTKYFLKQLFQLNSTLNLDLVKDQKDFNKKMTEKIATAKITTTTTITTTIINSKKPNMTINKNFSNNEYLKNYKNTEEYYYSDKLIG